MSAIIVLNVDRTTNCLENTADRFKSFVKNNKIAGSKLKALVLQAVIDENNQITDWVCN